MNDDASENLCPHCGEPWILTASAPRAFVLAQCSNFAPVDDRDDLGEAGA